MRSAFLASVSLAALAVASAAWAADAPPLVRKAPPPVAPSAYSWTGLYFGVHAGGVSLNDNWFYPADALNSIALAPVSTPLNVSSGGHTATGWLLGAQAGYNYQIKNWVLGVEGEFSWTSLKASNRDPTYPTNINSTNADFLATFGGRVGYAWDRLLVFGKLGLGWVNDSFHDSAATVITSGAPPAPPTTLPAGTYLERSKVNRFGLMTGLGAEYAVTPNWSVKAEYEHIDFGRQRTTFTPTAAGLSPFDEDIRQRADLFKLGVNYKINPSPAGSAPALYMQAPTSPASRLYGGVDYLLWSVKGAPLSVPLVTTGPSSNKNGFLLNSKTTVLYGASAYPASGGNDKQDFPMLSGSRVTLGYWLDDARRLGIEGSGFALQRGSAGFQASSDSTGSPGMRVPVFNNLTYITGGACTPLIPGICIVGPTEDGVPISIPGSLTGSVSVTNTIQLWGADAAAVVPFYHADGLELTAIAGVRYLDLSEKFNLTVNIAGIAGSIYAGQIGTVSDNFDTGNHFYGALLGLRERYNLGRWSVEATERLSLGVNHEVLNVAGFYQDTNAPFAAKSGPYGIFAQPANEGRFTGNAFAVAPEAQVKLGYQLTPSVKLTVGYDFLYISNVIRPTDQINRDIPKGQTFQQDGTVASTSTPGKLFKSTDFYAQGLNVGMSVNLN